MRPLALALALLALPAAAQDAGLTAPMPAARSPAIRPPEAAAAPALPEAAPAQPEIAVPEAPRPDRPASDGPQPAAVLRGLDTFSGHVEDFVVQVGGRGRFERILVTVEACYTVDAGADSYAFLSIADDKAPDQVLFRGWMVASSPALSALDHPRYDVWLQSCSTRSG